MTADKDYYEGARLVLTTMMKVISEQEPGLTLDPVRSQGRSGSTFFEEDFLKPLIRKHSALFPQRINEVLAKHGSPYTYLSVEAEENTDEAHARTMEDMSFSWRDARGVEYQEVVNIKATNGGSADNVGGWSSLTYAAYNGEKRGSTRKQALKLLSTEDISVECRDYFLLIFHKNTTNGNAVLEGAKVSSFFQEHADENDAKGVGGFRFNMAQPFPLQYNSSKSVPTGYGSSLCQRKLRFLELLLCEGERYYREQLLQWERARQNVQRQLSALEKDTSPGKGSLAGE